MCRGRNVGLRQSRAEQRGCSRGAGGHIMLQQGQRAHCLTAPRPRWTRQDHCHRILRTFTLFKDKCIVNFVSPNTRYVCRFTPPAAKGGLTSARRKTHYKWNQMSFSMVQNYLTLHAATVLLDFSFYNAGAWRTMGDGMSAYDQKYFFICLS